MQFKEIQEQKSRFNSLYLANDMIQVIIIDDEKDAINVLSRQLTAVFGNEIKIIGSTKDLTEAAFLIKEYQPELIFLDVVLGAETSGFDLLPLLDKLNFPFKIIFTTGYHQFAIKAIKKGAYDYLLKPIGVEDLEGLKGRLSADNLKPEKTRLNNIIIVNNSDATYKIPVEKISHFKGDGNYTSIFFTEKNKPILSSTTLNNFETEINSISSSFFRIHKSYLVNMAEIDHIKKEKMSKSVVMKNGEVIAISRLRYKAFSEIYF